MRLGLLSEGPNTLHDFQHQCHTWLEPVLSPNVSSNPHLRCIGHDTPSNGGSSTCLKETPDPAQQNQRGIARPTPPLSLGLHRPGPYWHLQAHISSLSRPASARPASASPGRPAWSLARPPSTAEDHRGSRVYWLRHRPVNSTW